MYRNQNQLKAHRLNRLNGLPENQNSASSSETSLDAIYNPFYDDNKEWNFVAYSYTQDTVRDKVSQREYRKDLDFHGKVISNNLFGIQIKVLSEYH